MIRPGRAEPKLLMRVLRILLALGFLTFLGCTVPLIEQVPVPEVEPLLGGVPSRAVILDRVMIDVPKGTIVGETRIGRECLRPEPFKWGWNALVYSDGDYHTTFDTLITQYNFRLPRKQASLFEAPMASGELLIAAKITNVMQNDCVGWGPFNLGPPVHKGSIRFSVRWEVYSLMDQKVILVVENEGSGVQEEFKSGRQDYQQAFANSLKGLLKNEEFRKIVTTVPELIK